MIDFRYHVISLVAVFFALAVGVVLGSGPLRTALVAELTDESDQLRLDLVAARAETEDARLEGVIGEAFVEQASETLLANSLDGLRVAIIRVQEPNGAEVTEIRNRLVEAGAEVTANLVIESDWTDSEQISFRSAFAAQVADSVVGVDSTVAPDRLLAHALAQTLVPTEFPEGTDPAEAESAAATSSDRAEVLLDLLKGADLISGTITGEIDAVLFVFGDGPLDDDQYAAESEVFAQVAGVMDEYAGNVVIASGPGVDEDVPSAILSSALLRDRLTTVTHATNFYGRITVALAVAQEITGTSGHYGYGDGISLFPGG